METPKPVQQNLQPNIEHVKNQPVEKKPEIIKKDVVKNDLYENVCAECHDNGKDGAPRIGFQEEWIRSFEKGIGHLSQQITKNTISHLGNNANLLSLEQTNEAILYIMQQTYWPDN